MASKAGRSVAIYLMRNDLRIHDNECLHWCIQNSSIVIPLLCFDRKTFGPEALTWNYKFPKTGGYRTHFFLESVSDLRQSYRRLGSDLLVRHGVTIKDAVLEIIQLCKRNTTGPITLVYQKEITKEETDVEAELHQLCKEETVTIKSLWGLTLYHLDDLPYPSVMCVPDLYTDFRKKIENVKNGCVVRPLMPTPSALKPLPDFIHSIAGCIPNLQTFIKEEFVADHCTAFPFHGGETAALERVEHYLFKTDNVAEYKETRNGFLGSEYSTKFSPWLAVGALSPRQIYYSIKEYERSRKANQSTYWVIFELLWRDYFKFVSLKHGDRIFYLSGIKDKKRPWKKDMEMFDKWRYGQTGVPFVDANMRELLYSGWMSNRGRQNVASFLVKDLGIDWRLGAEWFESLLLDHDVSSNYGNWNYAAGIGNDQRDDRKFNMIKQARDYDPDGEYVRLWVPELAGLKDGRIHAPWVLSTGELKSVSVILGESYPRPIIVPSEWQRHVFKPKASSEGQKRKRQLKVTQWTTSA